MADTMQEEIEDKIIDLIALGSRGRMVVFKPENSDKDLIVEKKGEYKKKVISLNIYKTEFSGNQGFIKKISQLVGEKEIKPEKNLYLLFAYVDIIKQDIGDNFWIVPSADLQALTQDISGAGQGKKDFSKFLINKKDFIKFLLDIFEKK